ncbi:hypothetical protein ACIHFD_27530 [Nonomuraea sp. NPDC051941]|uniref:hypothetical protein n=1 Tax=Nonomuraea sp. NPDC051941 TaxID=3364373 RepID=UPI0037C5B810
MDWRPYAARAMGLGAPVVSMVADGLPVTVRARSVVRTRRGFEVLLPAGVTGSPGPVCLTFHRSSGTGGQENVVLLGSTTGSGDLLEVEVERALNDWSLAGGAVGRTWSFVRHAKELRKRVRAEAARRDQPVPVVRR